jgi:hypothetical protein
MHDAGLIAACRRRRCGALTCLAAGLLALWMQGAAAQQQPAADAQPAPAGASPPAEPPPPPNGLIEAIGRFFTQGMAGAREQVEYLNQ